VLTSHCAPQVERVTEDFLDRELGAIPGSSVAWLGASDGSSAASAARTLAPSMISSFSRAASSVPSHLEP
jgi:hypothetical protein